MLLLTVLLVFSPQIWARPEFPDNDKIMHPPLPSTGPPKNPDENSAEFWINNAQNTIKQKLATPLNQNMAKNVIMFLGDGMSLPTLAAARTYLQGEEAQLSFEKFPFTGLSKTYAVDRQVPDSANTATAYLGGVKGNYGTIGVSGEVPKDGCKEMTDTTKHVHSIAYHSQNLLKSIGLVTTARVTHASPAGVYAHTANRDWESDADMAEGDYGVCLDIARQLIYENPGLYLNVIMGGGRRKFLPSNVIDDEGLPGERKDGLNLIEGWSHMHVGEVAEYVWNRDQLLNLDPATSQILGLFASDHMSYNVDRDPTKEPSLAEMTEAAIKVLNKNPYDRGYFLFVEGAKIDMGHHENRPMKALNETIEFSKAVQAAVDLTSEEDTLIVVTSDHAHTLSYSGYAARGNDVLAFGGIGLDGVVYTTLNYANGPGYRGVDAEGHRHDFTTDDLSDPELQYPATAPLSSETHGGEDVAIFARGPWAHLFSGVIEENVIPHLMMYASCVGEGARACDDVK